MIYYREVQRFRQPWLWALLAPVPVLFGWGLVQQIVLPSRGILSRLRRAVGYDSCLVLLGCRRLGGRTSPETYPTMRRMLVAAMPRCARKALGKQPRVGPVADGVRLELQGGEKLLLGSQAPEELARAILERKNLLGGRRARV